MRFHLGPPLNDPAFDPQPPWRALREPQRISVVVFLSLPLGLLATLGFVLLLSLATASREFTLFFRDPAVWFAFLVLVSLHELLHALVVPGSIKSPQLVVGFWPRPFLPSVHYQGELTRERFLLVTLSPLLVLSAVCLLGAVLTPAVATFWVTLGLLNALGAGDDLLVTFLLLWQVPRGACLRNQGWRTFWRPGA